MSELKNPIAIQSAIQADLNSVWSAYVTPEDVMLWNHASDDWTCPKAENDLTQGGRFVYRMEAKDGSVGFDFGGTYDEVKTHELIAYHLDDGRKAIVRFEQAGLDQTLVTVDFEPESENSSEIQRQGWQAILNNFKSYVESK